MDIHIVRIFLALLVMAGIVWVTFRIPVSYIQGYSEWVHEKHGSLISLSIGFLIITIGTGFIFMLTDPIKYSLIGDICGVVTGALILIVAWDNYRFWKTDFNSNNDRKGSEK